MPLRFIKSRKFRLALFITGGTYVLSLILFYLFRDKITFQSTSLTAYYQFEFSQPFQEYFVKTSDGHQLNVLLFKSPTPPKGLIFYTHGNADNLQRWGNYAVDFTDLGYDVLMYDYRSYGKSEGESNSNNLYKDGIDVFNWAMEKFEYPKVVLYGRSLGSTVASHLAKQVTADILILETPFAEFEDVVYWPLQPVLYFFPSDISLSNTKSLSEVNMKKVIFHGTEDWVVPLSSAEKLKPFLDQPDDFIIIDGAGHKNIRDFAQYHTELKEILK